MPRFIFKLPDVGEGTAEAEIVAWHAKVGDWLNEDDPLVDVMTDKATVELTAPVHGTLAEAHGAVGEMARVGAPIAEFDIDGAEDAKQAEPPTEAPSPPSPPPALEPEPGPAPTPATTEAVKEKVLASPAVRRRAKQLGLDLASLPGSGPNGRIRQQDLDAAVAASGGQPPASGLYARRGGVETVKVIGLRRKIAARMEQSSRDIPHFAYVEEVDVTELEALRAHLNEQAREGQPKLTLLPFLALGLARLVPAFPRVNAHYDSAAGELTVHQAVHLGIATQTEAGLMVPVVRHAEARDVWDLAAEIARLAQLARQGSAPREALTGSTITITSLGRLGGVAATPIINHPEVAIIGPNRVLERPVVINGHVSVRKVMNLSSSFDHRIVDGHDAASFIQRLKAMLEHPALLFMP